MDSTRRIAHTPAITFIKVDGVNVKLEDLIHVFKTQATEDWPADVEFEKADVIIADYRAGLAANSIAKQVKAAHEVTK
jgi:hypothetical protein